VALEVLVDGAIVEHAVLGEGWQELHINLGPPKKETVVLGLSVDRTFRPFSDYRKYPELPVSRDLRCLGIAVAEIGWEEAPEMRLIPSH
jgi:hypothetical protein